MLSFCLFFFFSLCWLQIFLVLFGFVFVYSDDDSEGDEEDDFYDRTKTSIINTYQQSLPCVFHPLCCLCVCSMFLAHRLLYYIASMIVCLTEKTEEVSAPSAVTKPVDIYSKLLSVEQVQTEIERTEKNVIIYVQHC